MMYCITAATAIKSDYWEFVAIYRGASPRTAHSEGHWLLIVKFAPNYEYLKSRWWQDMKHASYLDIKYPLPP